MPLTFDAFAQNFLGLEREDAVVGPNGDVVRKRRIYLDTTATALMPKPVWQALESYFSSACANSHTHAHRGGRDTTTAIEESRDAIGRLVGYDPQRDVVLFTSNGATGAINFLARALFPPEIRLLIKRFAKGAPPSLVQEFRQALGAAAEGAIDELLEKPLVVTTTMEHHSNLLPWMEAVGHHNIRAVQVHPTSGTLDLAELERVLAHEKGRVRLVTVTGVSNVTGLVNPVHEIAAMAHAAGAQILVDGAQWVPHAPVAMHPKDPEQSIDYLALSGHKLYAPGSRGALIGQLATLSSRRCVTDVGGGMVEYVAIDDYDIKGEVTAREEAGTPNIPGSIAMGLIAEMLMEIGMDKVAQAEHELTALLVKTIAQVPGVTIFGEADVGTAERAGVVSFNVEGLSHGLVAAYLNDFHNIAVRNECFCAHPYVKALLHVDDATERRYRAELQLGNRRDVPGMVRASLGIYSTRADIEALGAALHLLVAQHNEIAARYACDDEGNFSLQDTAPLPRSFTLRQAVLDCVK